MSVSDLVYLNVGGYTFMSTRTTLLNRGGNFFASLAEHHPDSTEFFIDRDPSHFRYILNFLRGDVVLPIDGQTLDELFYEASYYCLDELKSMIATRKASASVPEAMTLSRIQCVLERIARTG